MADILAWVRILDQDNRSSVLMRETLTFGYRTCPTLRDQIILEAGFRLQPGDASAIRRKHLELATHRVWTKGLRTAGSIFKNPTGLFAGKMIEQAGLKGFTIGGASISMQHANVIVTQPGAMASDVRAVLEITRDTVQRQQGLRLETEIQIME